MTMSRSDHYIDVFYLDKGQFKNRKCADYPELEANQMFHRTVAKLKGEGTSALICLRNKEHDLIKVERV
jgi:hypothetical protein